jgi:hypothetical protein
LQIRGVEVGLGFIPDGTDGATLQADKVKELELWAGVLAAAGIARQ